MTSSLKLPVHITANLEAHMKWMEMLNIAEIVAAEDNALLEKAENGLYLKERRIPPEVLGRSYAQYCNLINKMYDAYLNSVHLQRAPYIMEIISVLMKRMYEIRQELVNFIVNDYIYVDAALTQLKLTPFDIQIVVPYHFPQEARSDSMEHLLQSMWADAVDRKNAPPPTQTKSEQNQTEDGSFSRLPSRKNIMSVQEVVIKEVEKSEAEIQATLIQKHERYRRWYLQDYKAKCDQRKLYYSDQVVEERLELKILAAELIQKVYREFMQLKRQKDLTAKIDVKLGITPDPHRERLDFTEENNKMYEKRRQRREKIREVYMKDLEKENMRLIVFKKDGQIDDITSHIREWFAEWFYNYGFFPQYPYEVEGGTVMVIRGVYPTVDEQIAEDERIAIITKGKNKEQLKQEKQQAKAEAVQKAAAAKEMEKKLALQLFKARCNPDSDPGYLVKQSNCMRELLETLHQYHASWSLNDMNPGPNFAYGVYGYMKSILTEDLMKQIHIDCRKHVDELMRLELKLLIKAHQVMYQQKGEKFPKIPLRKKPKAPRIPKGLVVNDTLIKNMQSLFDLDIISKPTSKMKDVWGDLNYAAYEFNLKDPDVKYLPPGYGDVRRRLLLSCVFGSGVAPGAKRNKAVMLLGPERNGKSFLVDCVAGELNAIKIDLSPKVFSAICDRPAKMMTQVLAAARTFQPAVIYLRNVELVFAKKVPPDDKYLNAKSMKAPLKKLLKQMSPDDKIIFIATCSLPFSAQAKPMTSMFGEIILVPPADYNSLQMFFYNKLQRIHSMPRDFCTQPIAQLLQGYGTGTINQIFDEVMTPERIVKLNVTPFSSLEFLNAILEKEIAAVSEEDYQQYVKFFLDNSHLKTIREQYDYINFCRADAFVKLAKKAADDAAKMEREKQGK